VQDNCLQLSCKHAVPGGRLRRRPTAAAANGTPAIDQRPPGRRRPRTAAADSPDGPQGAETSPGWNGRALPPGQGAEVFFHRDEQVDQFTSAVEGEGSESAVEEGDQTQDDPTDHAPHARYLDSQLPSHLSEHRAPGNRRDAGADGYQERERTRNPAQHLIDDAEGPQDGIPPLYRYRSGRDGRGWGRGDGEGGLNGGWGPGRDLRWQGGPTLDVITYHKGYKVLTKDTKG
jgi:hypothetical protein